MRRYLFEPRISLVSLTAFAAVSSYGAHSGWSTGTFVLAGSIVALFNNATLWTKD